VDLSQRSKMNGNKETLRRDMKKEMISLWSNPSTQEQDQLVEVLESWSEVTD
jgi:hypothetical protein